MLSDYTAARGYIKPILERAIDTQYADDVLAATSDAQLLDLVRKERVKEMCIRDSVEYAETCAAVVR